MTTNEKKSRLQKLQEQLKANEEKSKTINQKIKALEKAKKARQASQDRKDDLRRKILIGSMFIKDLSDDTKKHKLLNQLNNFLNKKSDRDLFELDSIKPISKPVNDEVDDEELL